VPVSGSEGLGLCLHLLVTMQLSGVWVKMHCLLCLQLRLSAIIIGMLRKKSTGCHTDRQTTSTAAPRCPSEV
jgi:hypothetical protein